MRNQIADIDYIGSFLFATAPPVDPESMIPASDYANLPATPPPIAGYRPADVAGISCWNCGHFTVVGDTDDDGIVDGICNLFESQADGNFTCDRFVAHSDLYRQKNHTSWNEEMHNDAVDNMREAMGPSVSAYDYADESRLAEIHFAGGAAVEEDELVWKDILRTGEWSHTPTNQGVIKKHLRIVAEGPSDPANGVISLEEIETNFNDGAVRYVTVPLSDDEKDHKNIARLNTGLVKKLKLVVEGGVTKLRAGIGFTDPDVKQKVLNGTIPDVSAGVPFFVTRRRDNKLFKTALDHVCLTAKPFIDGLGPFGIAAADSEAVLEIESWEEDEVESLPEGESEATPPPVTETAPETESEGDPDNSQSDPSNEPLALSFREQEVAISSALADQLGLSRSDYQVVDINATTTPLTVVIRHHVSKVTWSVPFKITSDADKPVKLATVEKWKVNEDSSTEEVAASDEVDPLKKAQQLRELRLAQPTATGGIHMSGSALSLDGIELSDLPEDARQRVQAILTENDNLKKKDRVSDAEARILELSDMGLKEKPGALKFYRTIFLNDDGGPAIALFSDTEKDDNGDAALKERLTGIQILDRFIEALKGDGGVTFSDQALASGNDDKPANDNTGEKKDLESRVQEAQTALYGNRNRSGRK